MTYKVMVTLALVAIALLAISIVPTGSAFPNSKEVRNMTSDQFTRVALLWESEQHNPTGSVLINATLNEWCVENCSKLSLVDPTLFATEATQKAKLERTAQFLDWTFQTAHFGGQNHVAVDSIYCDGLKSLGYGIAYKHATLFTC